MDQKKLLGKVGKSKNASSAFAWSDEGPSLAEGQTILGVSRDPPENQQ